MSNLKLPVCLTIDPINFQSHNHLNDNYHLGNKKALFYNMKNYYESINEDPFKNMPQTFHIKTGDSDPEFTKFEAIYNEN